jgi:hypothetical protein
VISGRQRKRTGGDGGSVDDLDRLLAGGVYLILTAAKLLLGK